VEEEIESDLQDDDTKTESEDDHDMEE